MSIQLTHHASLAHIDDLRRDAEQVRRAGGLRGSRARLLDRMPVPRSTFKRFGWFGVRTSPEYR